MGQLTVERCYRCCKELTRRIIIIERMTMMMMSFPPFGQMTSVTGLKSLQRAFNNKVKPYNREKTLKRQC